MYAVIATRQRELLSIHLRFHVDRCSRVPVEQTIRELRCPLNHRPMYGPRKPCLSSYKVERVASGVGEAGIPKKDIDYDESRPWLAAPGTPLDVQVVAAGTSWTNEDLVGGAVEALRPSCHAGTLKSVYPACAEAACRKFPKLW